MGWLRRHQPLLAPRHLPQPADPRLSRRLEPDRHREPVHRLRRGRQRRSCTELRGNRPFHVVNMALNLVRGEELAWQERKAESFTVSPLHAGSFTLGYRDAASYGRAQRTAGRRHLPRHRARHLRRRGQPEHGLPLLAAGHLPADAVQRAARLVARQSGPAGRDTFDTAEPALRACRCSWPRPSAPPTAPAPYVYLSDGGHFENLGLYEMVLRRCRFIVVSDAGCDEASTSKTSATPSARSASTSASRSTSRTASGSAPARRDPATRRGSALLRPRPHPLLDRRPSTAPGRQGAGTVCCSTSSPRSTAPSRPTSSTTRRPTPQFPHESTADQFFSESQFESYRSSARTSCIRCAATDVRLAPDFSARCRAAARVPSPSSSVRRTTRAGRRPRSRTARTGCR